MLERGAEVVVLFLEPSGPGQAALEPGRVSELAKGEVVVGVPAADGVGFVASLQ